MSPSPETEESDRGRSAVSQDKSSRRMSSSSLGKGPAKRRTKTGCLTCRKRRIKCDEEKPFCKNCTKSKRECAGYVQPLVYKQQQYSAYPIPPGAYDAHWVHHHDAFSFNNTLDPSLGHHRPIQPYFDPFGSYPQQPTGQGRGAPPLMPSSQQYPSPAMSQPHFPSSPASFDEQNRRHSYSQPNNYITHSGGAYGVGNRQAPGWAASQYLGPSPQPAVPHYPDVSSAANPTSSYDTYPPVPAKYLQSEHTSLHGLPYCDCFRPS